MKREGKSWDLAWMLQWPADVDPPLVANHKTRKSPCTPNVCLPRQKRGCGACWHRTGENSLHGPVFLAGSLSHNSQDTRVVAVCYISCFGPDSTVHRKTFSDHFPLFWYLQSSVSPSEIQRRGGKGVTHSSKWVTAVLRHQRRCRLHSVKSGHFPEVLQAESHLLLPASRCLGERGQQEFSVVADH